MKERSIIFSTEMVKAILDGRKTQTRRVISFQADKVLEITQNESDPSLWEFYGDRPEQHMGEVFMNDWTVDVRCPYGQSGDRLWVRETWGIDPNDYGFGEDIRGDFVQYKADWGDEKYHWGWNSPIFMPRWASHINLEIIGVKVERLQDITRQDIDAEGTPPIPGQVVYRNDGYQRQKDFIYLWDSINTKRGYPWESNPWVWVIEFRRVQP